MGGFSDFFFGNKPTMQEAPGGKINKDTFKNFMVKAIGLIDSAGAARGDLSPSEYDLSQIKAASESDSYVKMALMKYSYLMFKAGYELKSQNDNAVEYLKTRFRMMSFSTGKPVDTLFQELGDDLLRYSNAFLVKSRVDKLMPGVNAKGVFADKPVGGYFRMDPATVQISRDKNGVIKKYQQTANGENKAYNPTEVIHIYMDKDANNAFGTPRFIAALEDVKLLRRIEGNIISLIYRFTIHIYQWIIGRPTAGFQATDTEVREAQTEIERMPLDGVIVTNEKTEIKVVGAEGSALDASGYLAYFEKRVFAALGVSEAQMGRGGAKQDADSMEAQVHDTVKYIQRILAVFLESYVLAELLMEGGFNPIVNEADIVNFVFHEISLDTKVKLENHEMLKFQSNVVTFEEVRESLGKPTVIDETRLYINMIETQSQIVQIDEKAKAALGQYSSGNTGGAKGIAGNGKTVSAKPNKAVTNNNRPTNQHGTGSVNIKSEYEDEEDLNLNESVEATEQVDLIEKTIRNKQKHKKVFESIYKKYETIRNDIAENNADVKLIMPLARDTLMTEIKLYISMYSYDGVQKAVTDISKLKNSHAVFPMSSINVDDFIDEAAIGIKNLLKDIETKIKLDNTPDGVRNAFSTLEYRIRFILEFVLPKVYWYAYVKTGIAFDIDKAYIKFDNSVDAEQHPAEINLKHFSYNDIPAYHSFCNCKVSFKAGDKE